MSLDDFLYSEARKEFNQEKSVPLYGLDIWVPKVDLYDPFV